MNSTNLRNLCLRELGIDLHEETDDSESSSDESETESKGEPQSYIYKRGLIDVAAEITAAIETLEVSLEQKRAFCAKLTQYRFVDNLSDISAGKYIRWIRLDAPPALATGGHVLDVKFSERGANILVRRAGNIVMKYAFDRCLSFQRLDDEEMMVLMANDLAISTK